MKLWMILPEDTYKVLTSKGILVCDGRKIEPYFRDAYKWIANEMVQKIGPPKYKTKYPLWSWKQYSKKYMRPDLRGSCHLPRGTLGYRLELDVPDTEVLLSDFDLWHAVLNNWLLPINEKTEEIFSTKEDFYTNRNEEPPLELQKEVEESWQGIYDFNPKNYTCYRGDDVHSIQATIWYLDLNYVNKADSFTAR